ncbi:MAG TPA: hypothetical protein VJA87_02010 [Candidatus Paceibacterota bacterium]
MEASNSTLSPRPNNSWGAIISILLILAIVVAGAYYAFTDRIAPAPAADTTASY